MRLVSIRCATSLFSFLGAIGVHDQQGICGFNDDRISHAYSGNQAGAAMHQAALAILQHDIALFGIIVAIFFSEASHTDAHDPISLQSASIATMEAFFWYVPLPHNRLPCWGCRYMTGCRAE
ncbi:hypothetical protein ACFS07_02625 [Undibacterium arcticum]